MSKTITVSTNDPKKASFMLTLRATVVSYVEAVPENLILRSYEGEAAFQSTTIRTTLDKPLVIHKVIPDRPEVKFTLTPPTGTPVAQDGAFTLTLEAPADSPPGVLAGRVTLSTNIPEQPEVMLNYNITVQKTLTVSPPEVHMNVSTRPYKVTTETAVDAYADATGQAVTGTLETNRDYPVTDVGDKYLQVRFPDGSLGWVEWARVKKAYGGTVTSIWVTKHKGEGFAVLDAKSDLEAVSVRTEPKQPGAYLVTIQYDGPMEEKTHRGTVTLATNDPREPSLTIPVNITVGQASRERQARPLQPPVVRPGLKPATQAPIQPSQLPQPARPLQPPGGGDKK